MNGLELFDEYEEWHLKCSHYMILCAFKGQLSSLKDFILPRCSVDDGSLHPVYKQLKFCKESISCSSSYLKRSEYVYLVKCVDFGHPRICLVNHRSMLCLYIQRVALHNPLISVVGPGQEGRVYSWIQLPAQCL